MKRQDRLAPQDSRGATVLETVVVLAIIVLFAGIVAPEVRNYFVRAKAARICAVYQMVAKGAMEYWADTGNYAYETGSSPDEADHQLFYKPSPHLPGWSGAYIDHPLSDSDNPLKGGIKLLRDIDDAVPGGGFDLDEDGVLDVVGDGSNVKPDGNVLLFYLGAGMAANDPIIEKVEETLEKSGLPDPNKGRVIVTGGALAIFIFKMP